MQKQKDVHTLHFSQFEVKNVRKFVSFNLAISSIKYNYGKLFLI